MSRLDDIERRLAALEAAANPSSLEPRVVALEDCLGITVTVGRSAPIDKCGKCGLAGRVGCDNPHCPMQATA